MVQEYKKSIESMRKKEIMQLLKYIQQEDPETCINILFVLSQCRSEDQQMD